MEALALMIHRRSSHLGNFHRVICLNPKRQSLLRIQDTIGHPLGMLERRRLRDSPRRE
jgi:hypothetical protein